MEQKNKLRVAIDTGPLISGHQDRGIGVHTQQLIKYCHKSKNGLLVIDAIDFRLVNYNKYDLVHFQNFNPFKVSLPLFKLAPKVIVTIHDLIPLIYPKKYPSGIKGTINYWIQKALIRRVDRVITISNTSKKDIARFLSIKTDRIAVIYLAPRKIFKPLSINTLRNTTRKYNLPEKFVLYVGDVNYNKNLLVLADACCKLKYHLVIVGKNAANNHPPINTETKPFRKFLKIYKKNPGIIRLGYVEDSDLVKIYNLARIYCQPSFYEGFGLSSLEAMASGTPVVASRINAHKEILGDNCIYFNPKQEGDLEEKLRSLWCNDNERQKLRELGIIKAKEYSWQKTATKTIRLYEEVLLGNN